MTSMNMTDESPVTTARNAFAQALAYRHYIDQAYTPGSAPGFAGRTQDILMGNVPKYCELGLQCVENAKNAMDQAGVDFSETDVTFRDRTATLNHASLERLKQDFCSYHPSFA